MEAGPSSPAKYCEPSIVTLGTVNELTQGLNGDICDGSPCNSDLYSPFSKEEKGKHPNVDPDRAHASSAA